MRGWSLDAADDERYQVGGLCFNSVRFYEECFDEGYTCDGMGGRGRAGDGCGRDERADDAVEGRSGAVGGGLCDQAYGYQHGAWVVPWDLGRDCVRSGGCGEVERGGDDPYRDGGYGCSAAGHRSEEPSVLRRDTVPYHDLQEHERAQGWRPL